MIIQLLLVTILLVLALVVVRQMKVSKRVRLIVLFMLGTGAYLVWQPEHTNAVAQMLGVGRGADLLLYVWIVLTLSVILLLYLKIVEMNQMLTEIARRLTLLNPIPPQVVDDEHCGSRTRGPRGAFDAGQEGRLGSTPSQPGSRGRSRSA